MIKKHLIACSAMLLVMLLAKVVFNSSPRSSVKWFPQKVDFPSEEKTETNVSQQSLKKFQFANERVPVKEARVDWLLQKYLRAHSYPKLQTHILHQKAARWFPVIEPILEMYGIPEDFKYMPLVESGFSRGTSHRGAAGYWQFMPGTARTYGLTVNSEVDERQNLRRSTVAACKYLKSLFGEFHNWALVAAAYNTGENNLHREIRRQKQRSYYKLKLNRETASYLYKLVSVKEIIENPMEYGYASRSKSLLASKKTAEVEPKTFINPQVDNESLKALSILLN